MSFTEIVEEIHELSVDEKLELKSLLNRDLLEEREKELLQNLKESKRLEAAGLLPSYDSAESFMAGLAKPL